MTVSKDVVIHKDWVKKFDLTVKNCAGALAQGANTIQSSLTVMNGIKSLKAFFKLPEVKELIEMSQDNKAGFLTDRSPAILRKHNGNPNKRYDLKPYTYDEIVDALLPCMLEGYRPHGNEINIISRNGMPVKNGKHRRIIEMTDGYSDSYGTPAIKDGHAFVKCRAKWKLGEETQTLGYDEGDEVHIKMPFGKYDSLDKVLGLAESKFYTRVLRRITGRFITDEPSGIDITDEAEEIKPGATTPPPPEKKTDKAEPRPGTPPTNGIAPEEEKQPTRNSPDMPADGVNSLDHVGHLDHLMSDPAYLPTLETMFSLSHLHIDLEGVTAAIKNKDQVRAKNFIELIEKYIG